MRKDFSHFENKDDFISAVAHDCIAEMSDEEKKTLVSYPDASLYHFSYGLYIRNTYIYPYKLRFHAFMLDSLSTSIMKKIITLLRNS